MQENLFFAAQPRTEKQGIEGIIVHGAAVEIGDTNAVTGDLLVRYVHLLNTPFLCCASLSLLCGIIPYPSFGQ
jgi:hypothetical protein